MRRSPHHIPESRRRRCALRCASLLALATLAGCKPKARPAGPEYADAPQADGKPLMRFAVHPLHNPHMLARTYQPLIDYLNRQQGVARFVLEASRDYAVYEEKFRRRGPEFLLANPWQALEAMKVRYAVIAMAGDAADFKGIILVRRDSGIRHVGDLRGKEISYPSPTALAACIMPQAFLLAQGLDVMRETTRRYVGSQESSIMNVYLRQTAAGATWPPPWRAFQRSHAQEAAALQVMWETGSLINNAVMARDDVPQALVAAVRTALLGLAGAAEGRHILANMETARFTAAADRDYEPVRRFIADFERRVRKVEDRS